MSARFAEVSSSEHEHVPEFIPALELNRADDLPNPSILTPGAATYTGGVGTQWACVQDAIPASYIEVDSSRENNENISSAESYGHNCSGTASVHDSSENKDNKLTKVTHSSYVIISESQGYSSSG